VRQPAAHLHSGLSVCSIGSRHRRGICRASGGRKTLKAFFQACTAAENEAARPSTDASASSNLRRAPPALAVLAGAGYYRRHSDARPELSQDSGGGNQIWACLGSKRLEDALLDGWDEACTVLALGAGYFTADCHGATAWWDVPIELHNKVNGRQKSLPPVDYVVLGEVTITLCK
jgi:hypothetical protein